MTAPYNIARWFAFSVTIEPRTSYGSRGSPVYGAGAAVASRWLKDLGGVV